MSKYVVFKREMKFKNTDIPKLNRLLDEYIYSQLDFSYIMDFDRQYSLYEALVHGDIDFGENLLDGLIMLRTPHYFLQK